MDNNAGYNYENNSYNELGNVDDDNILPDYMNTGTNASQLNLDQDEEDAIRDYENIPSKSSIATQPPPARPPPQLEPKPLPPKSRPPHETWPSSVETLTSQVKKPRLPKAANRATDSSSSENHRKQSIQSSQNNTYDSLGDTKTRQKKKKTSSDLTDTRQQNQFFGPLGATNMIDIENQRKKGESVKLPRKQKAKSKNCGRIYWIIPIIVLLSVGVGLTGGYFLGKFLHQAVEIDTRNDTCSREFNPCQNNGTCITIAQCQCTEGYSGPSCDKPRLTSSSSTVAAKQTTTLLPTTTTTETTAASTVTDNTVSTTDSGSNRTST